MRSLGDPASLQLADVVKRQPAVEVCSVTI
jgi:hypothetical protein